VRTGRIQIDDVVEVRIKGRSIVGRVTDVSNGVVQLQPDLPGRRVAAREGARDPHALAKARTEP
jgi:hypothetical protein